jgi:hypothetical protein
MNVVTNTPILLFVWWRLAYRALGPSLGASFLLRDMVSESRQSTVAMMVYVPSQIYLSPPLPSCSLLKVRR